MGEKKYLFCQQLLFSNKDLENTNFFDFWTEMSSMTLASWNEKWFLSVTFWAWWGCQEIGQVSASINLAKVKIEVIKNFILVFLRVAVVAACGCWSSLYIHHLKMYHLKRTSLENRWNF